MSGRRMKAARQRARVAERQVDLQERAAMQIPWYVRLFPRWAARWRRRWDEQHRGALKRTTKRVAHWLGATR